MILLIAILSALVGYMYTQLEADQATDTPPDVIISPPAPTPPAPTPPAPTPPAPTPPAPIPEALQCSVFGWNNSVYNRQSYISSDARETSGISYDETPMGVILNRSALVDSSYGATGAASIIVTCNQEVRVGNAVYGLLTTQPSASSIRIAPQAGQDVFSTRVSIEAQRDGARVRLNVFVHGGENYTHFAVSPQFDATNALPQIFTNLAGTGTPSENYLVPVQVGGRGMQLRCARFDSLGSDDLCYVVYAQLEADGALDATVHGFISPLNDNTGQVYEYSGVSFEKPIILDRSDRSTVFEVGGVVSSASPGSITLTGIGNGCVYFRSSFLWLDESSGTRYMIRWCEGSRGGFEIDSLTPITTVPSVGPIVQVAGIERIFSWSDSGNRDNENDRRGTTSLPQFYRLESFRTIGSHFTVPAIESNLHGVALACTASSQPTVDSTYFRLSRSGSNDPTLPSFYWLFFVGDVRAPDQTTATLRCGTTSVSLSVRR